MVVSHHNFTKLNLKVIKVLRLCGQRWQYPLKDNVADPKSSIWACLYL